MINTTEDRPLWMRRKKENKIVICETCRGSGQVSVFSDDPCFEGPYVKECYACSGMGRVARITVTEHVILTPEIININRENY